MSALKKYIRPIPREDMTTSIKISKLHKRFLDQENINLSLLVRDTITEMIVKKNSEGK